MPQEHPSTGRPAAGGARPCIAVLGGTGALGSGLAKQWARRGYPIIIGSRSREKALKAAEPLRAQLPGAHIEADELGPAAQRADIVALTVPYEAHHDTLQAIRGVLDGKILIDATVPLRPPKVGTVQLPAAGSAAVEAQQLLGPQVKVVSAFQNVAAAKLAADEIPQCDILVCGDDAAARDTVIGLVEVIGLKGWPAGPLANSAASEALTSVLIQINRKFGVKGAGLRIVLGS